MKKLLYIALVLICTSALWYGCKDKIELPGELHGVVTDKATGEPIKTAGVELQPVGLKTVTGTDGQYGFNEIEPGKYKLYITKTGYADWLSNEIVVKSEQIAHGDVQLEKLPPALRIVNDKQEDIDELDFGTATADVMRSFNIFNDGAQTLQWQITKSADWITNVSKESGELGAGKTQTIIVTIDRELLVGGNNVTTMHITSDDGSKQLKIKAVGEKRSLPVLNTLDATDITRTSAIFHGILTDTGTPSYTERGFVYGLSSMPTVENTISKLTVAVTADNTFQATAMGLEENKTYYVRAYAINKAGTAYSTNEARFTAQQALPKILTQDATDITDSTAILKAEVKSLGDPPVVIDEVGFVYGLMPNPMLDGTGVKKEKVEGTGIGTYAKQIKNLEKGKTYYVRAYMRNASNTTYGDVKSFVAERPPYVIIPEYNLMVQISNLGNSSSTYFWVEADELCKTSVVAGFMDWRLPTCEELLVIYGFRDIASGFYWHNYWTSDWCSSDHTNSNYHYRVYMKDGTKMRSYSDSRACVRAVRTITE